MLIECEDCLTKTCIISFNFKKKKLLCPCHDCIIKMVCMTSCPVFVSFFISVYTFPPSNEYKSIFCFEQPFEYRCAKEEVCKNAV